VDIICDNKNLRRKWLLGAKCLLLSLFVLLISYLCLNLSFM
jgi:hypothetical protein